MFDVSRGGRIASHISESLPCFGQVKKKIGFGTKVIYSEGDWQVTGFHMCSVQYPDIYQNTLLENFIWRSTCSSSPFWLAVFIPPFLHFYSDMSPLSTASYLPPCSSVDFSTGNLSLFVVRLRSFLPSCVHLPVRLHSCYRHIYRRN